MRFILIILFIAIGIVNIFLFQDWFLWGVDNGLSWTISSLLGWGIALISAIITLILILKSNLKSKAVKWIFGLVILAGVLTGTFAKNKIYTSDYTKESTELTFETHPIAEQLERKKANFEGLVLIARAGCPFCKQAIEERLVTLKKRNPELDVAVYMAQGNETDLEPYKSERTKDILFVAKDSVWPEGSTISISGFPTFVYAKNGTITHLWSNNDFGFGALDWVENKLN